MRLLLKKTQTVDWPVIVQQAQNGGKTKAIKLSATFTLISESEYNTIYNKHAPDLKGDHEVLRCVVQNIEGLALEDDNGQEQPFNKQDHMDMVLDHPNIRFGLISAYVEARYGRLEKNA